jgi:tRNA-binding EMAP/Myf-like protein
MKPFTPAEVKPVVSADALASLDIRVGMEPKRIRGELSEGMLFDIGYADGLVPVLAVPERPVPDGARAG